MPSRVSSERATPVRVEGANFLRFGAADLATGKPVVLTQFRVRLGELELPAEAITAAQVGRLEVLVPAGLKAGPHDVTVITPRGDVASLADGLTVVPVSELACADGDDDDLDGLTDCADPDCAASGCGDAGWGDGGELDGGTPDAGGVDGGFIDAGPDGGIADGGELDGGTSDAGGVDGGFIDAGPDGGFVDAGGPDGGPVDGGGPDGGEVDGGAADGGVADGGVVDGGAADGGADGGSTPDGGPNTPPFGCLGLFPAGAPVGVPVRLDPTCSWDEQQSSASLSVRFDFGDGAGFEPTFGPLGIVVRAFSTPGIFTVTVEVRDAQGASGFASRVVVITAGTTDLVVDTPIDEVLVNGTTSLREAITLANLPGAGRTIRFSGAMTAQLNSSLPSLSIAGTRVVGGDGVAIDFRGNSGCLQLANSNQVLVGLDLSNCSSFAVLVTGVSALVADTSVRPGPMGSMSAGVRIQGSGSTFGPGNLVSGFSAGTGITLSTTNVAIRGSTVTGCATGISANAFCDGVQVLGCVLTRNTQRALYFVGGLAPPPIVLHNTFHANFNGLESGSGPTDLRNNLFTFNTNWGVSGGTYAALQPNGFFQNTLGSFSFAASDAGIFVGDPRYFDADAGDFRLRPGSVMIDLGADAGVDVNGAGPGFFFGTAPDLGARESP